jgi:hypothetical protein
MIQKGSFAHSRSSRREFSQQSNIFRAIRQTAPLYTLLRYEYLYCNAPAREMIAVVAPYRRAPAHTHGWCWYSHLIYTHTWRARVKSSRCILLHALSYEQFCPQQTTPMWSSDASWNIQQRWAAQIWILLCTRCFLNRANLCIKASRAFVYFPRLCA